MKPLGNSDDPTSPLIVLRRYMAVIVLLNLFWEFAHMPLYTIWEEGTTEEILFAAIGIGVGYTIFSEWLNIVVRQAWAYRDIMPVVPVINVGLSPLLQWIVIPALAYVIALRPVGHLKSQHA